MKAKQILDADACYRALCSHDARFDGRFFTGVTSTGIYCRPVCRVRTPRRENCDFFELAAQAERAGFRPCLRCRPELAPLDRHWSTQDATAILVQQATRLLDDPQNWQTWQTVPNETATGSALQTLADRLGVSDRHLRRLFEARLGVSPLQYLQTRKLLTAKQLLGDTAMPITQVALTSGFASVRRFNAAFLTHYGFNPSQMRRRSQPTAAAAASCTVRLAWRPPYDAQAMLAFLAGRQLPGVERIETGPTPGLRRTARIEAADQTHSGWFSAHLHTDASVLVLRVSESLHPVLPQLIWRVRALFDLDADPQAINATLHPHFPSGDGLRLPGCFDGFELAVRAVLGQQITVAAARTLAARLVQQWGEPVHTPDPELNRHFPTPQALAQADTDALGAIGIVRQRQGAIQALARAVLNGQLSLQAHSDVDTTVAALQALPGIGPWTAHYIAMRALRWPDAWPPGDVALLKGLGLAEHARPLANRLAEQATQAWRPWRSYAVIRTWAGCLDPNAAGTPLAPTPPIVAPAPPET